MTYLMLMFLLLINSHFLQMKMSLESNQTITLIRAVNQVTRAIMTMSITWSLEIS